MIELAEAMDVRLRSDEVGDRIISGKFGNIHSNEPKGYMIFIEYPTDKRKNFALRKLLDFCTLKVDCDAEAVLILPKLPESPNSSESVALRRYLGVKRIRKVSQETKDRLLEQGYKTLSE